MMKEWWKSPTGELKHLEEAPEGWEPAGGHYNFETGQWVDDDLSDPHNVPSASEETLVEAAKPRRGRSRK